MGSDSYVLRAEGVSKSFGSRQVLKSASVWAEPGKITTLMGRNGSGKTTLLRIAAGQLRADQGTLVFQGRAHHRPRLARLAREGLMFVPQERSVAPAYRVRDHFRALATTFGTDGLEGAMTDARVSQLMDQRVGSLSGGERRRVSMALAMARRPAVLIVDEPLAGLAPKDQEAFAGFLRQLAAAGVALITSGHDARALLEVSDVIIWSVAGTTHGIGSPADALKHDQFRREYLGPGFLDTGAAHGESE